MTAFINQSPCLRHYNINGATTILTTTHKQNKTPPHDILFFSDDCNIKINTIKDECVIRGEKSKDCQKSA